MSACLYTRDIEVEKTREVTKTGTRTEQVDVITQQTASKKAWDSYTYEGDSLNGQKMYLMTYTNNYFFKYGYYTDNNHGSASNDSRIAVSQTQGDAVAYCFEQVANGGYHIYTLDNNDTKQYLFHKTELFGVYNGDYAIGLGFTSDVSNAAVFYVQKKANGRYIIYAEYDNGSFAKTTWAFNIVSNSQGIALWSDLNNVGDEVALYFSENTEITYNVHSIEEREVEYEYTETETYTVIEQEEYVVPGGYSARCVTSTLGYYDINLNGSGTYQLPDSYRGLGSVGYYDDVCATVINTNVVPDDDKNTNPTYQDDDTGGRSGELYRLNNKTYTDLNLNRLNNRYSMKVDAFNGNAVTIDEDIYISKYLNDNYFDGLHPNSTASQTNLNDTIPTWMNTNYRMHGIGMFDSVVMADEDSAFKDFKLTGSVNTEIYDNAFNNAPITGTVYDGRTYNWISVGGVCGWSLNGTWVGFKGIELKNLSVSGAAYVGGLLGSSGNKSKVRYILIETCWATNLSVAAKCGSGQDNRGAIGSFVGKVKEGGVKIYGTADKENNTVLTNQSVVEIASFSVYDSSHMIAGGLVGYAGNGVEAYDMVVRPKSGETITIGNTSVNMAGGIVGLMQPCEEKLDSCQAVFKNCKLQNINVKGKTYVGGFYGGTWTNSWVPYKITIDSCSVEADEKAAYSITVTNGNYVGGFVGYGSVYKGGTDENPNIVINDSTVKNYNILAINNGGYVGGFIGYLNSKESNSAVVCSITNSSVEYCELGNNASPNTNVGGAIGNLDKDTVNDKVAGYNVKLDHVEMLPISSTHLGAWIGRTAGTNPTIKFHGVVIYGKGFSKNVGNLSTYANVSFVYADYNNKNSSMNDSNKNKATYNDGSDVDMPKYPYVNVNPQSGMGTNSGTLAEGEKANKVISSDGAVLYSQTDSVQSGTNINFGGTKTYAYEHISVSEINNLDGRVFIISCARSDFTNNFKNKESYLSGTGGNVTKTKGTPILFTQNADGTYYLTSWQNGTQKYLLYNNDALQWNTTPTKFTVTVSGGHFTIKMTAAKSKSGRQYMWCKLDGGWEFNDTDNEGRLLDLTEVTLESTADVSYSYTDNGNTNYYTSAKTMAAKIYADYKLSNIANANYSRRYTTYYDTPINGTNTIEHYLQRTTVDDGDRISTYYTEKGYSSAQGYDDFACIVIANNTTGETTNLINRYAQLVTNTSTDYAGTDSDDDYFDIVINTCKLENGKFSIDTNATEHGLTYSNNQFSLNGSAADSLSLDDTFTLVDIQFKDPLNTDNVAYHLYIPVYTVKEMEISFSAAVLNGTHPVAGNNYMSSTANSYLTKLGITESDTHVDNLNTWFTTYIRYTYNRSDLVALLNSGNLNWGHDKYFYLDKTEHSATSLLPADTYMILVDPNENQDKEYHVLLNTTDFAREDVTSTTGRISFDLTKFTDDQNSHFTTNTFNKLIAKDIAANPDNNGKYNLIGTTKPANYNTAADKHYVYTEAPDGTKTYYQFVGSGGNTDLSLPNGYVLNEDYYISMYVPRPEKGNPLYGYFIKTPSSFAAPTYASDTNNAITKSASVSCTYQDRQVYIGDLFTQETKLSVLPNELEIDDGNKKLYVFAQTTIRPMNDNVMVILNSVKADIYHSFVVDLDRRDENGLVTNKIFGLDNGGDKIKAWYSVGSAVPTEQNADMTDYSMAIIDYEDDYNYINVQTVSNGKTLLSSFSAGSAVIYSRIELDFDAREYMLEFPEKVSADTGVSVRGASNLAYDADTLAFSSMSELLAEPDSTKHIYYRQSMASAGLNYYGKTELDSYGHL